MVYAVVLFDQPDEQLGLLEQRIAQRAYIHHRPVYFIHYNGTLEGLADELGFNDEVRGLGVIFPVANYTGYGPGELWEWIREKKNV